MKFAEFAQHLKALEETPSRLAMTEQLVALFNKLEIVEIQPACYLLQGRLTPQYESLEFNLSIKMLLRALNRLVSEVGYAERFYKQLGDVGLVAEKIIEDRLGDISVASSKVNSEINSELVSVFDLLVLLAKEGGEGSQERKLDRLVELFSMSDGLSARYIARIVIGKLRLGFSTMTILDSLSWMADGTKRWTRDLEKTWEKRADLGCLATVWIAECRQSKPNYPDVLESYTVRVGTPVMPALCQRLNSAQEIIEKLGEVIVEPKYDGLRLQIHLYIDDQTHQPTIKAYSRSLEDCTHMFPELLTITDQINCQSCILDCEAIGFDPHTGKLKVFQETITRKRKHEVETHSQSVPIRFYVFDVIALNGNSLLAQPLIERKHILRDLFSVTGPTEQQDSRGCFYITPYIETKEANAVHQFHETALADGLEGAVIKQRDSQYQSGRKGWRWVKIKEAEGSQGKLSDTLDVVMMGYYKGRGKRTQFGLGAILTGVIDETGKIVTIGKIGTGMSEDQLGELKQLGDEHLSATKPEEYGDVDKSLQPDIWLEPSVVIEVAADELTESPVHSAGFAMRFPRLLKIRDDKTWEQATTLAEIQQMRKLSA